MHVPNAGVQMQGFVRILHGVGVGGWGLGTGVKGRHPSNLSSPLEFWTQFMMCNILPSV